MAKMSGRTIGEFVAMVGIIVSLVFVGFEIRQNTIASRAAAYQSIGFYVAEAWNTRSMDREFVELYSQARDTTRWDEIDDTGWEQLRHWLIGALRGYETVYRQVQEGLLPASALESFGYGRDWRVYFPYLERMWPDLRPILSEDFARFMEEGSGLVTPLESG